MGDRAQHSEGATSLVAGRGLVLGTELRPLTIDLPPARVTTKAANEYRFVTRWRVEASREEVFAVLTDSEALTRWWPSVYRRVQRVASSTEPNGVGTRLLLHTQGWLPYRLCWELRVVEHREPSRLAIEASGDFVGSGLWTLVQDGDVTDLKYTWKVYAHKPLLRRLSFLLKPVFSLNHRWAMARGLERLEPELARRRGEVAALPRGPVSALWSGLVLTGVFAALALMLLTTLF